MLHCNLIAIKNFQKFKKFLCFVREIMFIYIAKLLNMICYRTKERWRRRRRWKRRKVQDDDDGHVYDAKAEINR